MPSHGRAVEITRPEAEPLADLYSVQGDLEDAAKFCRLAIEHNEQHGWQGIDVQEGLVIAAVVSYVRCFMRGQRNWRPIADLPGLTAEQIAEHNYFYTLRQKSVAHSVNVFDETWVTTTATERDGIRQPITDLHPGRGKVILSVMDARRLLPLVTAVLAALQVPIAEAKRELLEHIGKLPLDDIHAGDLRAAFNPSPGDVAKPRKRHRRPAKKA